MYEWDGTGSPRNLTMGWTGSRSNIGPSRSSLPLECSPMSCNLHTALFYPSLSSGILSGVLEKCFNMNFMVSKRGVPRGGVKLGAMLVALNICDPLLSKLLESPKLIFCFINGNIFFISSHKSTHWDMFFNTCSMLIDVPPSSLLDPKGSNYVKERK